MYKRNLCCCEYHAATKNAGYDANSLLGIQRRAPGYERVPGSDIEMAGLAIQPSNLNKSTMKLTVPPGSAPGTQFTVKNPSTDQNVMVMAPREVATGGEFYVTMYDLTIDVPWNHALGTQLLVLNPGTGQTQQMDLPAGIAPGGRFLVTDPVVSLTPDADHNPDAAPSAPSVQFEVAALEVVKSSMTLTLPPGSAAGQQFQIQHPTTGQNLSVVAPQGLSLIHI